MKVFQKVSKTTSRAFLLAILSGGGVLLSQSASALEFCLYGGCGPSRTEIIPNLYQTQKGDLYGLTDDLGNEVVPFEYKSFWIFKDGVSVGAERKDGKQGIIGPDGKILLPFEYDKVGSTYDGLWSKTPPSDGLAVIKKDGKEGRVNSNGQIVIPAEYDSINYNSFRGAIGVEKNGKYGRISPTGKIVIPVQYDSLAQITSRSEYLFAKKDGKWGYIAQNDGHIVLPFEFEDVDSNCGPLCPVKKDGKWGYIDEKGRLVIPHLYEEAGLYRGDIDQAKVKLDGRYILINGKGEKIR